MKISWIKYEKDDRSFKVPERLGFDVFKLEDPENTDTKIVQESPRDTCCKGAFP